ncbi:MAG TPA: tRNA (adenosine(37)-N6)-dimethylallyltransferase MiaA [Phaeodactylibacter sp.]|nr:tRNA (adenosine(37)-N6)-dimethylallyltransferase MiaA [Phaeodactylibacter sp.]
MVEKKYLIIIAGPTAVGKTALSIRLAQIFQTEIISADSRQFYREMNIGTAKASPQELLQVKHHFINSLSIQSNYSVGDFERDVISLLEERFKTKKLMLLTGGSGLYIRAVCQGLDEFPEVPAAIRKNLQKLYNEKGIEALQLELEKSDPVYYQKVDLQNPHRLIRALSVCRVSGRAFSSFQNTPKIKRNFTPIYISLTRPREELYQRINQRVDEMLANGLLDEANNLFPYRHLNALQTVGYQELFDYFENKISLEQAVELIKRNTRRYAKRQETWLRKNDFWKSFHPDNYDVIKKYILDFMKKEEQN